MKNDDIGSRGTLIRGETLHVKADSNDERVYKKNYSGYSTFNPLCCTIWA